MNKDFENLTSHVPYYACSDGVTLLDDGTVFTSLKISGLDTESMSFDELGHLKGRMKSVMDVLPKGFVVQVFHDYQESQGEAISKIVAPTKTNHAVAQAFRHSYSHYNINHPDIRKVNIYMFLIWPSELTSGNPLETVARFAKRIADSGIFSRRKNKEAALKGFFSERKVELINLTERVHYALKHLLSINSEIMQRDELSRVLSELLNPGLTQPKNHHLLEGDARGCPARRFMTMREEIVHSAIEEHAEYLRVNETYISALTLKLPSQFTRECHSEVILNSLDFPFSWSFSIRITDTASVNRKLEARQKRKYAFVASSDNPNISSSISKSEIEQAMFDQKTEGFNWHEVSCTFLIAADNIEILKDRTMRLISIFRDLQGSVLIVENSDQMATYISSLPGLGYRAKRQYLFSSHNVSDLIPLSAPPGGTRDLSCYLRTQRNTLFQFSTFSNEFNNWNQVVVGKIGSGKSFIVNNILTLALMAMDKPRVMILDLGQSFKRTTELWGGEYVSIDLDNPDAGLNPLPPAEHMISEKSPVLGLLDFTVQLLLRMVEFGSENRLHARVIKRALLKTYERVSPGNPILQDLHETLACPDVHGYCDDRSDRDMAVELAKLLEEYVGNGPYSRLFNRASSLTHQSDFFCFDFKNANQHPHIREIATYIVGGYICRKMVENPYPKFIVFDEFSTTMKHDTGAALCEMIAKNCRKHGVSFITISQQVDDFLSHKSSETLYKQANYKWFMKMDDNLMEAQETLKLTSADVTAIKGLTAIKGEFAEVYLVYGDNKAVLKLCPDPLAYWACTTDARDKRLLQSYQDALNVAPDSIDPTRLVSSGLAVNAADARIMIGELKQNRLLTVLKSLARLYPGGVDGDMLDIDPLYKAFQNDGHSLSLLYNDSIGGTTCAVA